MNIIIRDVDLGGAGGEAEVKTQFRNFFPGIGGTVALQQPIMSAWRQEFNQAPGIGKKLFLKHLILKKLDDFFTRTNHYIFPHITRPLGSNREGQPEGYWYQWVYGRETFPWEYPKANCQRETVALQEWSQFTSAFMEAGIDLSTDVCDADNANISQNIIHEAYKSFEVDLNFCWKRIDFGPHSMRIYFDKLCRFFETRAYSLGRILGEDRLALMILASRFISEEKMDASCQELDRLTADYRLSSLRQNTAEILLP